MRRTTLVFVRKGNEVLLAMKKRGFGAGHWNGAGGKQHDGETIEECAARECKEETCIRPKKLEPRGGVVFEFDGKAEWNQHCSIFTCSEWEGDPAETEEMAPAWFDVSELPFDHMVLQGKEIHMLVRFNSDKEMVSHKHISRAQADAVAAAYDVSSQVPTGELS